MTLVVGTSTSTDPGVYSSSVYDVPAIKGVNTGTSTNAGRGIWGHSDAHDGVAGYTNSTTRVALFGKNLSGTDGCGIYGEGDWGVRGWATTIGVEGIANLGTGVYGGSIGGVGIAGLSDNGMGVYGEGGQIGVWAHSYSGTALFAETLLGGLAGDFDGNVHIEGYLDVSGDVYKGGGGFRIDHPQDPERRILTHSFVESPERKNVYDGIATCDADGRADVELPPYIDELNDTFRYQLTPIGGPAPDLFVEREVHGGRFTIAGAGAGQRVSWQISGVRKDAWASANRIEVEQDKSTDQVGLFIHPLAHGQPKEKSLHKRPRAPANVRRASRGPLADPNIVP